MLTLQQEHQYIFLKEQLILILSRLKLLVGTSVKELRARFVHWTKPLTFSLPLGTLVPRDAQRAYSRQAMLCESALQSFRLYRLLDVWCRSRLPSAEKAAKDRFKTALRQRFPSAPGRKHANQKHQEEEHDHSCGHTREDQV